MPIAPQASLESRPGEAGRGPASVPAPQLFSDGFLEHVFVQGQVRHELLELPVLVFDHPEPPQLADSIPANFRFQR